jgi:hypothetical protein
LGLVVLGQLEPAELKELIPSLVQSPLRVAVAVAVLRLEGLLAETEALAVAVVALMALAVRELPLKD